MSTHGDIWTSTPWPAGWHVDHVAATGSTNADLLAAVANGTAGARTVLAADHQTAGRGRLDRRWDAPPGANLLVSIALGPVPSVPGEVTQRVGLAALRAARSCLDASAIAVSLKWPNDLLLDGRKLAGILAQRAPGHDVVVVGLGLNVLWAPEGAASLADVADLAERDVNPASVLCLVLQELDVLDPLDSEQLRSVYLSELATIGLDVRVELPGGHAPLHGRAVDVDELGRLVVDVGGDHHVVDVGDVVHVRHRS